MEKKQMGVAKHNGPPKGKDERKNVKGKKRIEKKRKEKKRNEKKERNTDGGEEEGRWERVAEWSCLANIQGHTRRQNRRDGRVRVRRTLASTNCAAPRLTGQRRLE